MIYTTQDEYKLYRARQKDYVKQYNKDRYHPVQLKLDKELYDSVLVPIATAQGVQVGTWIKQAIAEKLERDITKK